MDSNFNAEYFKEMMNTIHVEGFNPDDEKYIWKKQNTIANLLNLNK